MDNEGACVSKNFNKLASSPRKKIKHESQGKSDYMGLWMAEAAKPARPTHRPCHTPKEMRDQGPILA